MFGLIHRKYSLGTDYFMTAVNGFAVLGGIFVLNALIARLYGIETLGQFLLIKRTSTAIVGVLLLGMNVGLPSLIGRSEEEPYETAGLLVFAGYSLPLLLLFTLFVHLDLMPGFLPNLSIGYGVYTLGIALQYLAYGMLRGHRLMILANLLQLFSTALLPIIVFTSIVALQQQLLLIGMMVSLGASVLIGYTLLKQSSFKVSLEHTRRLVSFGGKRIVSFISQFTLLAGAPLLLSSYGEYGNIGYFNSLVSMVRIFLFVLGPLGIVLLPRISAAVVAGKQHLVAKGLSSLLKITLIGSSIAAIFLSAVGGDLLRLWLGSSTAQAQSMALWMLLSLPLYLVMDILRSPIDALSLKGINSRIYSVAALGLIASFYTLVTMEVTPAMSAVFAFVIAHFIAALGSFIMTQRLLTYSLISKSTLVSWIFYMLIAIVISQVILALNLGLINRLVLTASSLFILLFSFVVKNKSVFSQLREVARSL